jgi:hypothetical protein
MQVPNTNTLDTNEKVQSVLEFHDPAKIHFSPKKTNKKFPPIRSGAHIYLEAVSNQQKLV